MLKKIKHFFAVLLLAGFVVQPVSATETLDQKDMAFAFGYPAIGGDLSEIALLSNQEMMETEGEWGFLRYIPSVWNHVRTFRITGHYDIKPHRFSNYWGPLRGNRSHYQLTFYRRGVSNSHVNIRIPWGPRTTWGSHRR